MTRFSSGACVGTAIALLGLLGPAAAAQQGDRVAERALVQVLSREPWTDTGISIEPGDRVQIRAWGTVVIDRAKTARSVGPNGIATSGAGCQYLVTIPSISAESLVGNVADAVTLDGSGFPVGTHLSAVAPFAGASQPRGHLYLGVNHPLIACDRSGYDSWGLRNDTSGAFTAEIIVSRSR
jgi:hypothetical protein